jgi:tight adherence protein B
VAAARSSPVLLVAVAGGGALVAGLPSTGVLLVVIVGLVGLAAVALARRESIARSAAERRVRVGDYCEALLGELRAGQPATSAVERAVQVWPESSPVAAAARLGADVSAAYRRVATQPGAEAVTRLAAAWELCAVTGSGLALALEQLVETVRAEEVVLQAVQAELASARATARVVAALPLVVLALAQGAGASPWHFLLETGPGLGCLAAGAALSVAGLWWIDRIAVAAVREGT